MSTRVEALLFAALYYAVILGTGSYLSRSSKPCNGVVFAAHKLVAVVALAYLTITVVAASRLGRVDWAGWIFSVVAGLLFLATAASGALLSTDRPPTPLISRTHRLAPYLTVLVSAIALIVIR